MEKYEDLGKFSFSLYWALNVICGNKLEQNGRYLTRIYPKFKVQMCINHITTNDISTMYTSLHP